MSATDAMLARFQAELEERRTFMDGLVEARRVRRARHVAEEMELYTRARDRMRVVAGQMEPLRDGARIAVESRTEDGELDRQYQQAREPAGRRTSSTASAGAYIADLYYAQLGDDDAAAAARHRTTVSPPTRRPPTTPDCCPRRSCSRSSTSSRSPARSSRRSARPTSAPARGPTPG